MARRARIVFPDYPHHIVQKGNNGQHVFLDHKDFLQYLDLVAHYSRAYCVKILAYCLMINHVHILATPSDIGSLAAMMRSVAGLYSRYFNLKHGRKGRLWESRFYSSVVEAQSYLWSVALYIEWNPVRANLVLTPEEWEYSSARNHANGAGDPLITEPIFDEPDMQEYRRLLAEGPAEDEIKTIRACTSASRPIGGSGFLVFLAEKFGLRLPRKGGRPKGSTTNNR